MLTNPVVVALLGIGSLAVGALMLIHPVGPALFILATTPFDPIMFNLFGFVGNLVIVAPFLVFLFRSPVEGMVQSILGTPVQRAVALATVVLLFSFVQSVDKLGYYIFPIYGQRAALFLIVGVIAASMRTPERTISVVQIFVISMALFTLLSMLEFYAGIAIVPSAGLTEWGEAGLIGGSIEEYTPAGSFRLRGAGESIPINRLALQLLLPLFLAVGWVVSRERTRLRLLGGISVGVLFLGLLGTMSRSGMLGFIAGMAVVAVRHFRVRLAGMIGIMAVAVAALWLGTLFASIAGFGEVLESRWSTEDAGSMATTRFSNWVHGLKLFADSPLFGVGWGNYSTANVPRPYGAPDPHNAYVRLMAWQGFVGLASIGYMIYAVLRGFLRQYRHVGDELRHWTPFFLAGFIGILVTNLANSYLFDRHLYIAIGFAAALEHVELRALRREGMEHARAWQQSAETTEALSPGVPSALQEGS